MRLVFWSLFALLVSVIAQRGIGKTADDLMRWGQELSTVWWREYERWDGYQKQHAGGGGTFGKGNARNTWR